VRLEGLGQLKMPMTSSRIESATFLFVANSLNQLRYRLHRVNKFPLVLISYFAHKINC
jgi:hypothetical protein